MTRKDWMYVRPLQISPETAQKLAKQLGVPLEHLMHMPQHILLQKLSELAAKESASAKSDEAAASEPGGGNGESS